MVLLSSAHHREATSELDRVYGIMQVFDLRLGASRPGIDPKRNSTLHELEDELGQEILQRHPVIIQFQILTRKPGRGKGRRIGRHWRMAADLDWDIYDHLTYSGHKTSPCAEFSTTLVSSVLWEPFQGDLLSSVTSTQCGLPTTDRPSHGDRCSRLPRRCHSPVVLSMTAITSSILVKHYWKITQAQLSSF